MKQFSVLLIRILGLYLGLNAFYVMVPFIFNPNFQEMWSSEILTMFVIVTVVPMAGGVLLWFTAGSLAARIYGDTEPEVDVKDDGLVRAGTFLIGVFLLIQHISNLLTRLTSTGDIAYGSLVAVVLSALMILGAGFIGVLYNKLKYFGSKGR